MKRDVSTSTIGDEQSRRKPLMEAYMFQRRVLLGCSFLIGFALIIWIIAIATDHWIMIKGNQGIFVPETRRFFISSHSGIWRACRYTSVPQALPNSEVVRNFTTISYQNSNLTMSAKKKLADMDFFKSYLRNNVPDNMESFDELAKQKIFATWLSNDIKEFKHLRAKFHELIVVPKYPQPKIPKVSHIITSTNIKETKEKCGHSLLAIRVNDTNYNLIIPEILQEILFKDWNSKPFLPKLLWPYAKDLGISPIIIKDNEIIAIVPPVPPKRGSGTANGYEYKRHQQCKYIEMFPDDDELAEDLAFDNEVMDYIRTQASFACITIFIMTLGCIFSFYTFANPRYMFKRLAGGIHLISSATSLVVIQVMIASVDYQKKNLSYAYPPGAELSYGYGVYLGWFVFGSNAVTGFLFLWYSGKKKGAKAPTDELAMADEAVAMGR